MTPEQLLDQAVTATSASLGEVAAGKLSQSEYQRMLRSAMGVLSDIAGENSPLLQYATEMLEGQHIVTFVGRLELEQSSQRWIIWFADQDGNPQQDARRKVVESIRTDRIDGPYGAEVTAMIDSISVGDRVRILKVMEPMAKGDDRVRVARRIIKMGTGKVARTASPARPEQPPTPDEQQAPSTFNLEAMLQAAQAKLGTQYRWDYALTLCRDADVKLEGIDSHEAWRQRVVPLLRKAAAVPEDEEPF